METQIVLLLLKYKYLILFPMALFEGPITAIISGYLLSIGVLDLGIVVIIFLLADIIPDSLFYFTGYLGYKNAFINKHILNAKIIQNQREMTESWWRKYPGRMTSFAKLISGMAIPSFVSAGILRVPYKKIFPYISLLTALKYGLIVFLGYLAGASYRTYVGYIKNIYLYIPLAVAGLFAGYYLLSRYIKNKYFKPKDV
ncbi:MAG: hypothetical protein WCO10_02400 [bacterium]